MYELPGFFNVYLHAQTPCESENCNKSAVWTCVFGTAPALWRAVPKLSSQSWRSLIYGSHVTALRSPEASATTHGPRKAAQPVDGFKALSVAYRIKATVQFICYFFCFQFRLSFFLFVPLNSSINHAFLSPFISHFLYVLFVFQIFLSLPVYSRLFLPYFRSFPLPLLLATFHSSHSFMSFLNVPFPTLHLNLHRLLLSLFLLSLHRWRPNTVHQTPRFWNNFTCGWSLTAKSMADERKIPRTTTRSDKREAWVPLGRGRVSQCVGFSRQYFLGSDFFWVYKDESMFHFKTRSRIRLMATAAPMRASSTVALRSPVDPILSPTHLVRTHIICLRSALISSQLRLPRFQIKVISKCARDTFPTSDRLHNGRWKVQIIKPINFLHHPISSIQNFRSFYSSVFR